MRSLRLANRLTAAAARPDFHVVLTKVDIVINIITSGLGEVDHHHCHLHHLLPHHVHLVLCKGDCDSKEDCQGNLICGKDNCEGEWFEDDDDCCVDIGIILGYCVVLVSTLSFKEDFQNPKR